MSSKSSRLLLAISGGLLLLGLAVYISAVYLSAQSPGPGSKYPEIKTKLTPLATALPKPATP